MKPELDAAARREAIASLQKYFKQELEQPLGQLPGGMLLDFFLAEIGPAIYNRAIADAQSQLLARVQDLDIELHEEPFRYWHTRR